MERIKTTSMWKKRAQGCLVKKPLYVYILLVINPDPTTELNIPLTSNDQDMLSDKTQITFLRFGSFSLTRGYLRLHIRGIMRDAITHPYPVDVKP